MSQVLLLCGPAGSGKSTYARAREVEGFTRLSIDEEAWRRGHQAQPLPGSTAQVIEQELRRRLVHLLREGHDVVVDLSFWSRAMREQYRELARSCGVEAETVYFDTPRDVVMARVRARTGGSANEIRLTEEQAAAYFDGFEVPTAEEGPLHVVRYQPDGAD